MKPNLKIPAVGLLFLFLQVLPGFALGQFAVSGALSVFLYGSLPILAGSFAGARKDAPWIIALTVISGSLARAFDQEPFLSALLIAVVAFVIGIRARRGLSSPILLVGILLGFLVISPPKLGESGSQLFNSVNPVLITAILLTLGGLWAMAISALIAKRLPQPSLSEARPLESLIPYALALATSTGISTYVLLVYAPGGAGAWLLLTIFIVLKPERDKTLKRTRDRVLGTLAGAIVAFTVIEILQALNLQESFIQLILAGVFLAISMSLFVTGPYWKYVIFLTPGVVLLDSNVVSNQTSIDMWRVIYTVVGAALALLTALVIRSTTNLIVKKFRVTPDQSH